MAEEPWFLRTSLLSATVSLDLWGVYSDEPALAHESELYAPLHILVLHFMASYRTQAGSVLGQAQPAVAWSCEKL